MGALATGRRRSEIHTLQISRVMNDTFTDSEVEFLNLL
ncbi:alginate O-acetyltransferase [Pseudomonas putida]|nr:alginate O-acetyltransferase [Pseudomonas putida]NVN68013.1 alginate O-acetyltransferase [Pseudomonas putida]